MNIHICPTWFRGIDIFLELIFVIITAILSYQAYKLNKLCKAKECTSLSWGFGLLSASYAIQLIMNALAHTQSATLLTLQIILGTYIATHLIGLLLLAMTYAHLKKTSYFILMFSIVCVGLILTSTLTHFYLVSAIILGYLAIHTAQSYAKNAHSKTLLVSIAFTLLTAGSVLLSVTDGITYTIAHLLVLLAYVLLLLTLLWVKRYEKKA
jgi:hypothetical protein